MPTLRGDFIQHASRGPGWTIIADICVNPEESVVFLVLTGFEYELGDKRRGFSFKSLLSGPGAQLDSPAKVALNAWTHSTSNIYLSSFEPTDEIPGLSYATNLFLLLLLTEVA